MNKKKNPNRGEVRFNNKFLTFGAAILIFSGAILGVFIKNGVFFDPLVVMFDILFLTSVVLLYAYFVRCIKYNETGFVYRNILGKKTKYDYSEVTDIEPYSDMITLRMGKRKLTFNFAQNTYGLYDSYIHSMRVNTKNRIYRFSSLKEAEPVIDQLKKGVTHFFDIDGVKVQSWRDYLKEIRSVLNVKNMNTIEDYIIAMYNLGYEPFRGALLVIHGYSDFLTQDKFLKELLYKYNSEIVKGMAEYAEEYDVMYPTPFNIVLINERKHKPRNRIYEISEPQIQSIKQRLYDSGTFCIEILGSEVRTWDEYVDAIFEGFRFETDEKKDYSLYRNMMTDLSWMGHYSCAIIVYDYRGFLADDLEMKAKVITGLIDDILPYWEEDVAKYRIGMEPKNFNVYLSN